MDISTFFNFFIKSNVFEKLNKFIGIEKNKIYNELDYIKNINNNIDIWFYKYEPYIFIK